MVLSVNIGCDDVKKTLSSERGSLILDTSELAPTQEYWLYIRTYNRYGLKPEDDAGRSKKGDVVVIAPVVEGQVPTKVEQKEWAIVKADLTDREVENYRYTWKEEIGLDIENKPIYKTKAYRRHKIDVDNLVLKEGLNGKVSPAIFKSNIREKTDTDLQAYNWGQRWFAMTFPVKKLINPDIAYAAATTSKICAVGDVCTDEDYNTLTAWEDAVDGILDGIQTAECYDDDGGITDQVTIDGSTTTSDYYMKVTVPAGERHAGIWNTSKFYITSTGVEYGNIAVRDNYTVIEYVQATHPSGNARMAFYQSGGSNSVWESCIAYGCNGDGWGVSGNANPVTFKNCLAYDNASDGWDIAYVYNGDLYNCSAIDNGVYGYNLNIPAGRDVTLTNCIAYGNGDQADDNDDILNTSGAGTIVVIYTATQDATADDWSGAGTEIDISDPFTAYASDDFSLASGATPVDAGTSLAGTVDTDIIGTARPQNSVYDMGCFEYVAAAVTPSGEVKMKTNRFKWQLERGRKY